MAILGDGSIFLGGSFSNYDFESLDDLYRKKYFLGGLYLRTFPASFYFQRLKPDGELVTDLRFDRFVHLPNGETHLSLAGQALNGFSLESSTNLHDWSQVATNAMPNSGLVFRDASSTNASQRFYRVR